MRNFKYLIRYYGRYKFLSFMTIVFCICYAVMGLFSPILEGKMLGSFENFNINNIILFGVLLCILRVSINILFNVWSRTVLKLNGNVNFDLKKDMLDSMTSFEIRDFDNTSSGVFISRLNKDTYELSELFDSVTDYSARVILKISFIVYAMFLNFYLGLFLIFNVIIVYVVSSRKLYYYEKTKNEYKKKDEGVVGLYSDIIRGVREIKSLNLKDNVISNASFKQREAIDAEIKYVDTKRSWDHFILSLQDVLDLLFVLISLYFINNNSLSVSSFLILFLYKSNVIEMCSTINLIRECVSDGVVAANRVFDVILFESYNKEKFGDKDIKSLDGDIVFDGVFFKYNDNKLFENLNFTIKSNCMTAIVGKSGEGKSTILKLIDGTYRSNSGSVMINGIDINSLSVNSIRNNISIVSQSPYIFNMSIIDNIRLAKKDASDNDIIDICKRVQIHDDIISMKDGYDTMVGESGVILSGGQKQRIAIARALLKESNIILLDEATSSLDNSNQKKIKDLVRDLSKNHTIVIVAHRFSTIVDADSIIVLDKHNVSDIGSHKELMKKSIVYKNLYEIDE